MYTNSFSIENTFLRIAMTSNMVKLPFELPHEWVPEYRQCLYDEIPLTSGTAPRFNVLLQMATMMFSDLFESTMKCFQNWLIKRWRFQRFLFMGQMNLGTRPISWKWAILWKPVILTISLNKDMGNFLILDLDFDIRFFIVFEELSFVYFFLLFQCPS